MKPKRIQRKRTKGWRMPPNTVYVGRPSRWGNTFINGCSYYKLGELWVRNLFKPGRDDLHVESVEHSIELFKKYDVPKIDLSLLYAELNGKDLACWCRLCAKHKNGKPLDEYCPDCDPCHVDVLGKLANG